MEQRGTLFVCGTPIGNLEDITYRALRILKEADHIAAEDTRQTLKLLNHFDIQGHMISCHEHNERTRAPQILEYLEAGESVALVSDAGMPGISDPGHDLIRLAIEAGIEVVPIPGSTAFVTALVVSGLPTRRFAFEGFLPREKKKRRLLLESLAYDPHTLIFYEAPHRIKETLKALQEFLGDREACLGREMTKKFEEVLRGRLSVLRAVFEEREPRGEMTLIVAPADDSAVEQGTRGESEETDPVQTVLELAAGGMDKKEAVKQVARERALNKRSLYQAVVDYEHKKGSIAD